MPRAFSDDSENLRLEAPSEEEFEMPPTNRIDRVIADLNDPLCVCGRYRSEHEEDGCPEGFRLASDEPDEEEDDDPVCVCGVYRSEHFIDGCPEGFQTSSSWDREKAAIAEMSDDEFERIYHPEEYR